MCGSTGLWAAFRDTGLRLRRRPKCQWWVCLHCVGEGKLKCPPVCRAEARLSPAGVPLPLQARISPSKRIRKSHVILDEVARAQFASPGLSEKCACHLRGGFLSAGQPTEPPPTLLVARLSRTQDQCLGLTQPDLGDQPVDPSVRPAFRPFLPDHGTRPCEFHLCLVGLPAPVHRH
jgi:hypothetical protein